MDFAVGFQIYDDLRDVAMDASQSSTFNQVAERLNIVSIFTNIHQGSALSVDSVAAAKAMALEHLQRAEASLNLLPNQSGLLLQECCIHIRSQLNELR